MIKKIILLFFFLFLLSYIYSIDIQPEFIKRSDSVVLKELFSINIGIMNLKNIGKIQNVNPVDSQNAVNSLKNILDTVPSIKLSKKNAVDKAIRLFKSKLSDAEKAKLDFLERKIFYSSNDIDSSYIYQFFLELQKNATFSPIAKQWFENFTNPFYILNNSKPFDFIYQDDKTISESKKINDKDSTGLDFLFSGTVEKIENLYFITFYVYSYLENKRIKEFSIISDSENLTTKINDKMKDIIPEIFLVNYGTLTIDTEDAETGIYLDSNYIGKKNEKINFIVPGKYVLSVKKENYEEKFQNIEIANFENKVIKIKVDNEKKLQVVNFYIEPLGTKIFINSVFQGKTPFKKAFPVGNYIISAKNDLYQNYRYFLSIDEVKDSEITVVFHLLTKDVRSFFKLKKTLYYVAFWNFTFSLVCVVPSIIFAMYYFYQFGSAQNNYGSGYISTEEGARNLSIRDVTYGLSWAFSIYSILSVGWLFFTLADYLSVKDKQDFIPILEYYKNKEGEEGLTIGAGFRLR